MVLLGRFCNRHLGKWQRQLRLRYYDLLLTVSIRDERCLWDRPGYLVRFGHTLLEDGHFVIMHERAASLRQSQKDLPLSHPHALDPGDQRDRPKLQGRTARARTNRVHSTQASQRVSGVWAKARQGSLNHAAGLVLCHRAGFPLAVPLPGMVLASVSLGFFLGGLLHAHASAGVGAGHRPWAAGLAALGASLHLDLIHDTQGGHVLLDGLGLDLKGVLRRLVADLAGPGELQLHLRGADGGCDQLVRCRAAGIDPAVGHDVPAAACHIFCPDPELVLCVRCEILELVLRDLRLEDDGVLHVGSLQEHPQVVGLALLGEV
mmetsp:Transcript_76290/g.182551  ORF Transcript_76290/g.182551 Transcript_76290/m.182551 type:complete len:319 (-) Transcript_76290:2092-3048(-)